MLRALASALLLPLVAACSGGLLEGAAPKERAAGAAPVPTPGHRPTGERIPAFSGGDPQALGLVRVEGYLWMRPEDAEAHGRGWARAGRTYVRLDAPSGPAAPPREAFTLRTDHVRVQTNVAWSEARAVARKAEAHARRFMLTYGDVLDLRLPEGPLPVVVHATRDTFRETLAQRAGPHAAWGAFYDAAQATVHLSTQPAPAGALPWVADLRHEMTHQILDLARPRWRRGKAFGDGWFWLWEGIALHAETLGDGPDEDSAAARMARFRRRLARDEVTPLPTLVGLSAGEFAGRHYDQSAALMRYLLDPARPRLRRGFLRLLARLMRDRVSRDELEPTLGTALDALDRAWRASWAG